MIHFPPIQTGRLNVRLRELTLREALALAATPLKKHEAATAQLLGYIVATAEGQHADPRAWTVQERMLVVAHYIACTVEGGGNFAIGDGHFLDYLDHDVDAAPAEVDAGEAAGDQWRMRQLTGAEAEAMEGLCTSRQEWLCADMAARLHAAGEAGPERPDPVSSPGPYATWLSERREVFMDMPESDFEALFGAYERGRAALHHLFWLGFDNEGHEALARAKGGGAGTELAPARFPAASCVGDLARWLGA